MQIVLLLFLEVKADISTTLGAASTAGVSSKLAAGPTGWDQTAFENWRTLG
jgi:hypothetical protein